MIVRMIPYEDLCAALDRWNGRASTESPGMLPVVTPVSLPFETDGRVSTGDDPPGEIDVADVLSDDFS
jgi:hypothetical protein